MLNSVRIITVAYGISLFQAGLRFVCVPVSKALAKLDPTFTYFHCRN